MLASKCKLSGAILLLVSFAFLVPLLSIIVSSLEPFGDNFHHLQQTLLPKYIINSVILLVGVGLLSSILAVTTAWLVTNYKFFGHRFFSYALIFPIAIPAYISSYVYGYLFEYAGPMQSYLREIFQWQKGDYYFPPIRSLGGAIFVMSFMLYPYIFILVKHTLPKLQNLKSTAHSFGKSDSKIFFNVVIPIIRPSLIAGLILVSMEVLSDFGVVQNFAIDTFTTAIYHSWFGLRDYNLAAKLSSFLLLFVAVIIFIEKKSRNKFPYYLGSEQKQYDKKPLSAAKSFFASLFCFFVFFIGFLLPLLEMLLWFFISEVKIYDPTLLQTISNSLYVSMLAACVALVVACFVVSILRFSKNNKWLDIPLRLVNLGYLVPGSVAAVAILIAIIYFEKTLANNVSLIFSSTLYALVFAYVFRFNALSLGAVEEGFGKIDKKLDAVSMSLGKGAFATVRKIHLPIASKSMLVALLLVCVESLKELPATLIIRPFNFETLSTKTYLLASDERIIDSGAYALVIVMFALMPVILFNFVVDRDE